MVFGPLFLFGGYLYKKKYMNFLVVFGTGTPQQYIVSANTWSSCLAYCEGTGKEIQSIGTLSKVTFFPNVSGTNSYQVTCSNAQGDLKNLVVWETNVDSLLTWLDSQGYNSIKTIQQSDKSYVVV